MLHRETVTKQLTELTAQYDAHNRQSFTFPIVLSSSNHTNSLRKVASTFCYELLHFATDYILSVYFTFLLSLGPLFRILESGGQKKGKRLSDHFVDVKWISSYSKGAQDYLWSVSR